MKLVLVTGMSCSGKTTIAKKLSLMNPEITVVSLDWFYKETQSSTKREDCELIDFDHPDAFDWERVHRVLGLLLSGIDVIISTMYNFQTLKHEQCEEFMLRSNNVILFEGIFVAYDSFSRERADFILFANTPIRECFNRRERRDVEELGRDQHEIVYRWETLIVPSYKKYIEPYKKGNGNGKTILINSTTFHAELLTINSNLIAL